VDAFYSTCAQLLPVLLIVLTLQLGSNGPSLGKLKGLLWLGGLAEVAALFGLVMSDVARPDWWPEVMPWVGLVVVFLAVVHLVIETCKALWGHRTMEEIERLLDEWGKTKRPKGRQSRASQPGRD
jgi:hypothetical protein